METGAGGPFSFEMVGAASFYPAAWYDWAALLGILTGAAPTVTAQMASLVTVLAIWPIGMAWLATSVLELRALGRFLAGPLSLASVSFPLALLEWGPLYPNVLGLALTPAMIAAGWHVLGLARTRLLATPLAIGALVGATLATLLSHPGGTVAGALMLLPAAIAALVGVRRRGEPLAGLRGSRPLTIAVILAVAAFPVAWFLAATRFGDTVREPFMDVPFVILELGIGSSLGKPPSLALAAGVLVGLWYAVRRRSHPVLIAGFGLLGLVYLAATTFPHALATAFAAPFYNDPYRAGANLAIPTIVLALLGWEAAGRWVSARWNSLAAAGTAAFVALVTLLSPGWSDTMGRLRANFALTDSSDMLTRDEWTLIERIPDSVGPDGAVVVNPWHGGGLVYALTGRHVSQYYMPTIPSEDVATLNATLREGGAEVCEALHALGAEHVLVLEDHILWSVRTPPENAGLRIEPGDPGFEEVDREGDAVLYRITACAE